MKFPRSILMAFAIAPLPIGASAEAEIVAPTPPRPAPEMAQLDYFVGTWRCVGTDIGAVGSEYRIERVVTATKDLDGFWLATHWEEQRTAENPHPWNVETLLTYDSNAHVFNHIFRDNYALWSATGTTPGWEGDKFVIVGDYMVDGQKLPYRDVYTRHSDGSYEFGTATMRDGQWSTDAAATCRK